MKKVLRIFSWAVICFFSVVTLVYVFYQFETFSADHPDLTYYEAIWLTILNPTGLTGSGFTFPETLPGKLIGIVFVLISISLLGVFIGKIGDKFTEYREYRKLGYHGTDFEDHYVIIGWDNLARLVTEQLLLSDQQVAIVTDNKDNIDLIYEEFSRDSVFVLLSTLNNYENLKKVNVQGCHRLLINNPSDRETLVNLLNIKSNDRFEDTDCLVTIKEERMRETFIGRPEQTVSDHESGRPKDKTRAYWAYSLNRSASHLIASTIFEPLSAEFLHDLITSVNNDNDEEEEYELQLYEVTEGDDFYDSDTKFDYAFDYIYMNGDLGSDYGYQCMPIGISKRLNGKADLTEDREVKMLPPDDTPVEAGDYLILIAKGTCIEQLEEDFDNPQGLNPNDKGKVDWTRLSLFDRDDRRHAETDLEQNGSNSDKTYSDHIVIIGWDEVTRIITSRLLDSDKEVVIVTEEASSLDVINECFPGPEARGVHLNLANYDRLDDQQVNITESERVFVNLSADDESLVAIMNLEERFGVTPREGDEYLNVVAAISNMDLEQSFKTAGVTYTVSHDVINAKLITSFLYEEDVAFAAEDLLAGTHEEHDADLQQYKINGKSECKNKTYLETLKDIKNELNSFVVGIAKEKENYQLRQLPKNPDDIILEEGDYLMILLLEQNERQLQKYIGSKEGY